MLTIQRLHLNPTMKRVTLVPNDAIGRRKWRSNCQRTPVVALQAVMESRRRQRFLQATLHQCLSGAKTALSTGNDAKTMSFQLPESVFSHHQTMSTLEPTLQQRRQWRPQRSGTNNGFKSIFCDLRMTPRWRHLLWTLATPRAAPQGCLQQRQNGAPHRHLERLKTTHGTP